MAKVFWAVPMERQVGEPEASALMNVADHCGRLGYARLHFPYAATDLARNRIAKGFLAASTDPEDVLVMLDQDHLHPPEVVERLVSHNLPLVSALCFRRITPFGNSGPDPLMWQMVGGRRVGVRDWEPGSLVECVMAGFGAIAIRRSVFTALEAFGYPYPYFRHHYQDGSDQFPREDQSFGEACRQAGISFHCDTGLVCPHVTWQVIDETTWAEWKALEAGEGSAPRPETPSGSASKLVWQGQDQANAPHLVDIVLLGHNQPELTERLLHSIIINTNPDLYRIFYIDNGSHPKNLIPLMKAWPQLHVLSLPYNTGFVRATNYGMALAALTGAPFVMWLNNDVEIPHGDDTWLERLLAPFQDPTIWAVGPVSNNIYGHQWRETAGEGLTEVPYLIGYCLLARQSAVRQIGLADERFTPGNYEDNDWSLRLRLAGGRLVVVESVFVHHGAHLTFKKVVNLSELLATNRQKFIEKWGEAQLVEMGMPV